MFVTLERIQIMKHKTNFTYRSTLKINNVEESDAQVYTCIGQFTTTFHDLAETTLSDYATYKLVVYGKLEKNSIL